MPDPTDIEMLARIMDPIAWDRSREGAYPKVDQLRRVQRQEAIRFVERLYADGYAVVKLPEKMIDQDGFETWPVESRDVAACVKIRKTDGRLALESVSDPFQSPRDALSLAAALIAAARYVQEGSNG